MSSNIALISVGALAGLALVKGAQGSSSRVEEPDLGPEGPEEAPYSVTTSPSAKAFEGLSKGERGLVRGAILYEGPSRFGGAPIVAIMTYVSDNPKTGPIPQVFIFRSDEYPTTKSGLDKAVCGRCPLAGGKGCYVNLAPIMSMYGSLKDGRYSDWSHAAWWLRRNQPRAIRVGAYGDPVAVPNAVWVRLASIAPDVSLISYTHQWPLAVAQPYKWFCMASVDSPAEMRRARSMGWRTFRAKLEEDELIEGQVICPATTDEDLTCLGCRACSGIGAPGVPVAPGARRPGGIVVDVHGNPRALAAVKRTLKQVREQEAKRQQAKGVMTRQGSG